MIAKDIVAQAVPLTDTTATTAPQQSRSTDSEISDALRRICGCTIMDEWPLGLYAFSGKTRCDSVAHFACTNKPKLEVIEMDIEISDRHDMACDAIWSDVLRIIMARRIRASLWSPPCSTFSFARKPDGRGPMPLRGCGPGEIYGLPNLTMAQLQTVKLGTLLATRTAEALVIHLSLLIPFIFEQPEPREGERHMTLLPEFKPIMEDPRVIKKIIDQCRAGAGVRKRSLLLLFLIVDAEGPVAATAILCNHPAKWWTVPWSGESYHAPHPTVKGRQWAIPSEDWATHMRASREPAGEFISRSTAAYPCELNQLLATWMRCSAMATARRSKDSAGAMAVTPPMTRVGRWSNVLVCKAASVEELAKQ